MSKFISLICPVSTELANENVVRLIALFVVVATLLSVYLNSPTIILLLGIDFSIRAYTTGKYSLLKQLAILTSKAFQLPVKRIPAAPKKFAASLGAIFSLLIAASQLLQLPSVSIGIGAALLFCALLESVFSICIGCYIYTFILKFQFNKN